MSNISQFFKGDTRKKNRKIFVGPSSNVTWTAPPSTSEIEVHVWGGGGHGGAASPGEGHEGGGGGGYVGNTFQVVGGSTVVVSAGAAAGTSTAVITNPNGASTLTATGGVPGGPYAPEPTRGNAGSGSYSLHPAEPTVCVFTASGGVSRNSGPDWPQSQRCYNAPSGGGGAGFIYGPGGNGGVVPGYFAPQYPSGLPSSQLRASPGGGGIKGDGGYALAVSPYPFAPGGIGGAGGGFMNGDHGGLDGCRSQIAFGGAGISGRFMTKEGTISGNNSVDAWFYLEDIDGIGGSSGSDFKRFGNPSPEYPQVTYAKNGLAGGGGAGFPSNNNLSVNYGRIQAGHGGIFGGGGGGGSNGIGGNGGFGGGGGGGRYSSFGNYSFSGEGGSGIVIIYY